MVKGIRSDSTGQDGYTAWSAQQTLVSEDIFAQLLTLLTNGGFAPSTNYDIPNTSDIVASLPTEPNKGAPIAQRATWEGVANIPPSPAPSSLSETLQHLGGGRESIWAGGESDPFPAPLPSLLSTAPSEPSQEGQDPTAPPSERAKAPFNSSRELIISLNEIQQYDRNLNPIADRPPIRFAPAEAESGIIAQENGIKLHFSWQETETPQAEAWSKGLRIDGDPAQVLPHRKPHGNITAEPVSEREPHPPLHAPALPLQAMPTQSPNSSAATTLHQTSPISDVNLHEQVAQMIERLAVQREEHGVHLRLDPPELGTVDIHIQVSGSEVHAWLSTERDLTRQMLEQQVQQLREQLASRGLQLAHFEVQTGSQGAAYERGRYPLLPFAISSESTPRPNAATDSLHLFGQWSAWA